MYALVQAKMPLTLIDDTRIASYFFSEGVRQPDSAFIEFLRLGKRARFLHQSCDIFSRMHLMLVYRNWMKSVLDENLPEIVVDSNSV